MEKKKQKKKKVCISKYKEAKEKDIFGTLFLEFTSSTHIARGEGMTAMGEEKKKKKRKTIYAEVER